MRTIAAVLILMIVCTNTFSQDYDSLKRAIIQTNADLAYVKMNLGRAHRQYKEGITYTLIGLATSIVGYYVHSSNNKKTEIDGKERDLPILMILGGGITGFGVVITIDSHKFIGRAGSNKKINKNIKH